MKSTTIHIVRIAVIALILGLAGFYLSAQTKQSARVPPPSSGNQAGKMGLETAELLRQVDSNHDGFISQKEWNDFFADRDQDGDQRLSPEEIQTSFDKTAGEEALGPDYGRLAAFERLDTNRNDAIDASEWPGKKSDFQYLDANGNGSLSREEFLARNGRWWNEPFENLDFNGDKIISRSEWLDSKASFDRLDRNHNGAIEPREFYDPR